MDFTNWKNRTPHKDQIFITDGIIDKDKWQCVPCKILYILKEAYESNPNCTEGWDLCKYLRDISHGKKGKTWWKIAQCSYGIHNFVKTGKVVRFPGDFKSNEKVINSFMSTAVINIKKSKGNKNSDKADLEKYVTQDWDLLTEQITEINPGLIICGYTWEIISNMFDNQNKIGEWLYKPNNFIFVDYWHPANRYPNKLNYYSLMAVLELEKEKWLK